MRTGTARTPMAIRAQGRPTPVAVSVTNSAASLARQSAAVLRFMMSPVILKRKGPDDGILPPPGVVFTGEAS